MEHRSAVQHYQCNGGGTAAVGTGQQGRTPIPVKFSLRLPASVDPAMPFLHNEDLEIRIYKCTNGCNTKLLLQTSVYGSGATDYRINGELYILNFKT